MIVVSFFSGLGNQMFQYAMAIVLGECYGYQNIKGSVLRYQYVNEHNGYELDQILDEQIRFLNVDEEKKFEKIEYIGKMCHCHGFIGKHRKLMQIILYCERKMRERNGCQTITDYQSPIFNEAVFLLHNVEMSDWYVKGYWQNWGYFKRHQDIILQKLQLTKVILNEVQKEQEREICTSVSVSIHVRGGDYLNSQTFDICGERYYEAALKRVEREIGIDRKNMKLFVFTDEISYAKKIIPWNTVTFISNAETGVDMYLMAKCRYNIIANSTYSFWGAFLNNNKDKKVISPKYFYIYRGVRHLFSVPDEWIVIQNEDVY